MTSKRRSEDGVPVVGAPSFARVRRGSDELPDAPLAWPIAVAGLIAASWMTVISLVLFAVIFSFGWVATADPNSEYTTALQTSVATWLLSQGVPISAGGLNFSLIPLLLTVLLLRFHVIAFTWMIRSTIIINIAGVIGLVASYAVSCAGFGLVASLLVGPDTTANASRAMLGCAVTSIIGAIWAMSRSKGQLGPTEKRTFSNATERTQTRLKARSPHELVADLWQQTPLWIRDSIVIGVQSVLLIVVASFVLVVVLIGFRFAEIQSVINISANSTASVAVVSLLSLSYVPTVAGWIFSILVGPGVVLGAGSSFTLITQVSGAMPAVPFFALIPLNFPPYAIALGSIPLLAAVFTSRRWSFAQRVKPARVAGWLPRVLIAALVSALFAGLLAASMSGSFGGGRFSSLGASIPMVMAAVAGWVLLGTLIRIAGGYLRSMGQ
ncbi:MAG: hypothetical protein RLZZ426_297 [Actinomycetota bacterium]